MSHKALRNSQIGNHLCNQSSTFKDPDEHHSPYKLMFLFFIVFIGCLVKTMFVSLRLPYTGVILCISLIGGILFNVLTNDDTFHTITTSSPDLLLAIFLPVLVFESAYRTEYHAFIKSLYSILILSMIGYFLSLIGISVLNKYLLFFQGWSLLQCVILGVILSATRPVTIMRPTDYGKTKRLIVILEGETVINNCLAVILFNGIKTAVVHHQTWQTGHFFKTTAISLLGGIGLGAVVGILQIIGLPYLYDDPIGEITITIAVPYMLYWICYELSCSGVIAIVVLGILLSNHKTAISSEAAIFMEKFWDMLVLLANTIIYLFTAFTLAELIKPNVRVTFEGKTLFLEIGLALFNYFICYLIRFLTIMILTLSTKLFGKHHLSWKECLLATCGGFKGSICLILALALASEYQLAEKLSTHHKPSKFKYQILIHTTTAVFLSSCINSIYSVLIKILKFNSLSETKYLHMNQCVNSLRTLVEEKIRLLKKEKHFSNADWTYLEKNFHLENPYLSNLIKQEENVNAHHDQCSKCHQQFVNSFNQVQYEDLVEEIRIRIIHIQKRSFRRQYRDYEISSQTVRILSSLCDFAMDSQGQYISIDLLKYYYKPRRFDLIWKYLRLFFGKFHHCIRDDRQQFTKPSQNSCLRFCFNILQHRRYNLILTCIILLNVIVAIIRSALIIPDQTSRILTIIQSICLVIYFVDCLMKIYAYGIRIYCRGWIYYRIEWILLILALIECGLEYYDQFIDGHFLSNRVLSILQILIIIQIFRLLRILECITKSLVTVLDRMVNRYVVLSLELCQAYISSEDDVLSKLARIIEIDHVRDQFRRESTERRKEVIVELTFIQSEHPNVSASVKTRAAIQKLLNYSKNRIHHMVGKGLLGENEGHQIIETVNKRLHTELVPCALSFPLPLHFLHVLPWLDDPDLLEYVLSHLHVKSFSLNEYIYKEGEEAQALFLITAGYVEIIKPTNKYHDALSIEKYSKKEEVVSENENSDHSGNHDQLCYHCRMETMKNFSDQNLFQESDDESEENQFNSNENLQNSLEVNRSLHAPGDIIGHVDLLNGQNYTATCQCITNTLIWCLKSDDLMDLFKRFNQLRIFEKIWHYTAVKIAETVLYRYLNENILQPNTATEQEHLHIYGHLKHAFLIPESYLTEHEVIHSSHELILIQGQLKNITSSLIYTSPCFIQIEFGQCGLKPLNTKNTKILVLRNPHHSPSDEFLSSNDLPDILTHLIYDEKLSIYLPRVTSFK